nr:MAG TPA: hypothetical protein [Caudoviricetes sp.]DAI66668.1 MAG TPA: hypothetical protein [Caudoviricetes sp.]
MRPLFSPPYLDFLYLFSYPVSTGTGMLSIEERRTLLCLTILD